LDLRTDEKLILEFIEQEVEVQREVSASQIEVDEFIYFLNQPMGRARFSPFDPIFTSTERDSAVAERDSAVAERDSIINSSIWRFFSPYRRVKNLLLRN
jgi:hypothetical protein